MLTLGANSHDSSSSTSKQVLQLLSSYNARRGTVHASPTPAHASPSHGESDIVEAHNTPGGGGMEFLRQAAADNPRTLPIELEIVDRRTNPPTSDQMRSIIDYLAAEPRPAESAESEKEAQYTSSGFNVTEHERRQKALQPHLATASGEATGAGMPKIKDGPLIVNWDEGFATTSLEGVQDMLKRLQQDQPEKTKDSGGCTIC